MLNNNNTSLILIFSFFIVLVSSAPPNSEVDDENPFTYVEGNGKGPKEWGHLNPLWKECGQGHSQSPIDLNQDDVIISHDLTPLKIHYKPAPAAVKNRGHDIEVKWSGDAGSVTINDTSYQLIQCHWHSPSEHTFNGTRFPLEIHEVYGTPDGKKAVVAIIYKYGLPDPFISRVLYQTQSLGSKEERPIGVVSPEEIDVDQFCGTYDSYYRYIGSLTTPPCTEGVVWTILKKMRTVTQEQVLELEEKVHDGYKRNARPTQAVDGRKAVFYSP